MPIVYNLKNENDVELNIHQALDGNSIIIISGIENDGGIYQEFQFNVDEQDELIKFLKINNK